MHINTGRRGLIGGLLALGGSALVATPALADTRERRLAFRNVHTNERVDARYYGPTGLDREGIAEINHGLRDWRTGQTHLMDRDLLDLLGDLRDRLGVAPRKGFDLISGYRSPETNGRLKEAGGAHSGVAGKSQHMLGKASDIAMPGVPLATLRAAAYSMRRGGVGYYPRDGFVHVDTGQLRTW
ncbi:DUF882 domain-containing protein [Sphingomonas prati]|uniref:Murein endopeptidase K n=1 Tax=Sphingomonas prati TaxID=1843237 RepID=A0A7W9BU42_9SPHN|nr:DUF882 domain-containing protein [Sphingomonas prati]MBB5730030.1 uncharacterized protein YcbK (DUF882 family) [Sphingomonas prati]GGE90915.1 hypothetical protein GCM10011404_24790 [Sphingomonas prati]